MNKRALKSDVYLLLTAAIWGFAFVAQRVGMVYVGPYIFNGVRFLLGALVLLPFAFRPARGVTPASFRTLALTSLAAGIFLFLGSSLQQVGIVYTTAGKAGFITGLYVVLVPFLGIFFRHKIGLENWMGAFLAVIGLYFLSMPAGTFGLQKGDFYVFLSAFFWAAHVHTIGFLSPRMSAGKISVLQYAMCSALSFVVAFAIETFTWQDILNAAIPILYGGLMSVGVAYSLQVVGQKFAPPTHAAIILSLEAVFAVLGGWLLLAEALSMRGLFGCLLMLAGMVISQVGWRYNRKRVLERVRGNS